MTTTLDRYTWDEAQIARLATANGFKALGINPATVRWWASEGLIEPAGKAPGGAHLYSIAAVTAVAERPKKKPGPRARGMDETTQADEYDDAVVEALARGLHDKAEHDWRVAGDWESLRPHYRRDVERFLMPHLMEVLHG